MDLNIYISGVKLFVLKKFRFKWKYETFNLLKITSIQWITATVYFRIKDKDNIMFNMSFEVFEFVNTKSQVINGWDGDGGWHQRRIVREPNIALDSSKYSLFPAVGHIKFIYMHMHMQR